METKHLVIAIAIFTMIGVAIYYLGSTLMGMEKSMTATEPNNTVNIGSVLEQLDTTKQEVDKLQKKQEEAIENIGY